MTLLRLPAEVLPVFDARLEEAFPDRAQKVRNAVMEVRGGKMNESAFGARFAGRGPRWVAIERMFEVHARRVGLTTGERPAVWAGATTFRRPSAQQDLFDR
jgi:hypothetical protein